MKKNYILFILFLFSYLLGYLGFYFKIFPYNELKFIKNFYKYKINPKYVNFDLDDRFINTKEKINIDCPENNQRTLSILIIGQSPVANTHQKKIQNENKNIVNFFNDRCFIAESPLLSSTNSEGEYLTLMGKELLKFKDFDKILLIPFGIGGASISDFSEKGRHHEQLINLLKNVRKKFKIDLVLYDQGTTDAYNKMGKNVYKGYFYNLKEILNKNNVKSPIFMSVHTFCNPYVSTTNIISQAQQELIDEEENIYLSYNADKEISFNLRYDNCHYNFEGQIIASKKISNSIIKYYENINF